MFNLGDWVQITPTPDLRWVTWYNSKDIYGHFLGKIGEIEFVTEDEERPGKSLYAVKVHFPFGFMTLDPGYYYEWFRSDHLIRSSKSQAGVHENLLRAGKELQEWEKFKKESTDKMLRHVFGKEETKKKEVLGPLPDPDSLSDWDEKTIEFTYDYQDYDPNTYLSYNNQSYHYNGGPDTDYSYSINYDYKKTQIKN